jgi:hypothetical protein
LLLWLGLALMLLDALSFCISTTIMERSRKVIVLSVIKDLQVAIKSFEHEYGHYPLSEAGSSKDDLTLDSANNRLIGPLLGDNLQDNRRGIRFIELPIAKNGRGGLVGDQGSFQLLDQWGHPYRIILDTNGDNQVRNPDRSNTDAKIQSVGAEWLPLGVVVFSAGIDGVPHTADDITSWRDPPPTPRPILTLSNVVGLIGMLFAVIGIAGIILAPGKTPLDS